MTRREPTAATIAVIAHCLCLGLVAPVIAGESAAADRSVQKYPNSYFAQFNPQTARDMVDHVPGFSLDPGADLRGFGGGAGNVLIDGARPSSKSGGLEEALARINASTVVRIEVIRGSAGASETSGQSVVANVITQHIDRTTRWELQLERAAHGKINTAVDLVYSTPFGAWDTSTKINAYQERKPLAGTRISRDADENVTFGALEDSPSETRQLVVSSQAKRRAAVGLLLLSARLSHSPASSDTQRFGFDGEGFSDVPDQRQFIYFERERSDAEVSVDWTSSVSNDWTMKLLSLSSFEDFESQSLVFLERPVGSDVSNSLFDSQQKALESIFRATLGRTGERDARPEFGAEIAYNRLDSDLSLRFEDINGVTDVAPPAANVVVQEIRGEVFANLLWRRTAALTVETGIGAEASKISVSGDAENTQSFFFAKPFATLIYDIGPGVQFRLGARHVVGQLDFADFAASASAADDRLLGGNPELGPDQTTRLSSSIDLRSDTRGALNIEVFHEWRDDVLEQIILPSGAPGLGNAGSARVWGLRTTASLPLSTFISGGLVELEAEFLDSRFNDSIIASTRSVSGIDSSNVLIEFRQDLNNHDVAWGIAYRPPLEGPFYFADEISLNRDGRHWSAFVETTRFSGLKMHLEFAGIGEQNFYRERRFFDPDRSGIFQGSQVISRDRGMFMTLTVSGQF